MKNYYNPHIHRRQSMRLAGHDYSLPGLYFVTICTFKKFMYFGEIANGEMKLNRVGEIAQNEWEKTPRIRKNVRLDEFVIMPNHIHGIIEICTDENRQTVGACRRHAPTTAKIAGGRFSKPQKNSISMIINQFKSTVTKQCREIIPGFAWQRGFYDRIIRNQDEFFRIREYIIQNPATWEKDIENPMRIKN